MRFSRPHRRRMGESVVPMINVVFLLLIFFMMSARIAAPPPFDVTLPQTEGADAPQDRVALYVSADGRVGFDGLTEEAAWAALAVAGQDQPLTLRGDADLPARDIAAFLSRLASLGFEDVQLAVQAP